MFKKLLLTIGALLISVNLSFAQEEKPSPNCHPIDEVSAALKHDGSVVVATMVNKNLGAMALVTDPDGDWYLIYFNTDQVCFAVGGIGLSFAPPPSAPSQDVAK